MERTFLIIYMLGFIDGKKSEIPRKDRMILLDQQLIKLNQPPLTIQEKLSILKDLADEVDTTFVMAGLNRKDVRSLTFKKN